MVGRSASFARKTAIITGGASGIGFALGAQLVSLGARVVLADVDGDAVSDAASQSTVAAGQQSSVLGRQLDVRDREAVRALVDESGAMAQSTSSSTTPGSRWAGRRMS